ncbi:hypothetical protein PSPO01_15305 [Paraphaeosphaeria sporulosa]
MQSAEALFEADGISRGLVTSFELIRTGGTTIVRQRLKHHIDERDGALKTKTARVQKRLQCIILIANFRVDSDMRKIVMNPRAKNNTEPLAPSSRHELFYGAIDLLQKDTESVLYGFEDIFPFQSSESNRLITFFTDPNLQNPLCAPWFDVEIISDRAPIDPVIGPAEGYHMCVNQQNGISWHQARTGNTRLLVRFSVPREGCQKVATKLFYCIIRESPDGIDEDLLWTP